MKFKFIFCLSILVAFVFSACEKDQLAPVAEVKPDLNFEIKDGRLVFSKEASVLRFLEFF